jgi:LysM repeat protein
LYFTQADNPVNKYVLEYGTKSDDYPYGVQDMGVNSGGQMTFLVKSLSPNTTYYFRVRGGNGCAAGSWSNEISAKTKGLVSFNQLDITQSELESKPVEETPPTTASCQTYTVKSGDSLWSIAENSLGDGNRYKEIIEQNKDKYPSLETSNNLEAGWELKVNCGKQISTSGTQKALSQGGYDVKVKVVDTNKKPVEGAKVTIHSKVQETVTNKDGIAQFKNVEAGDHKVLIAYNNFEGEQSKED